MTPEAWRLAPGIRLLHRGWDDGWIVYFAGPGDTHLVDAVGLAVLRALERDAQPVDALVDVVCGAAPGADPTDARYLIARFLADLTKAGLVDPVVHA